ncbi:uncharacterized protein LACBIDRAFT_322471 [Laccaria bicolor S238N-H82]|uniref:Predicted protein n=1 Tax=Laccaria bicolor (strain S238N-H82 / ATCC MYA-4686) TaxID=486041 RepID=B0CWE9_LACBS|nr:uncharacterized protein LACBIDRAFT_322471 [Laccaria bicolor S238N-H82]EDR13499.1 predicted protein [Laccaria bicolor S238N-H82]|eukprot:XP_001875997.1 predicted protein [Laccaria bicolor S238N-H82]
MSPWVLFLLFLTHSKLQLAIAPAPGDGNNKICLMGVKGKQHLSEWWYLLALKDFATIVQISMRAGIKEFCLDSACWPTASAGEESVNSERVGYIPELRDYAHYEAQRSKLLHGAQRSLCMGGIENGWTILASRTGRCW